MKSIQLAVIGVLLAVGLVLHAILPGIVGAMKIDMLLTMMFLAIILFPNVKSVAVTSLATGVISALTTTFPGGQIANLIEKPITGFIIFGLYMMFKKLHGNVILASTLTAIGTLLSGAIFLASAAFIIGLPAPFAALFLTVVLPTTLVNTIVMTVLFPILQMVTKRSNIAYQA
jgi:hypothetical protein